MFDLGMKIVLLSSTSKDKFGPRRGSIGYVTYADRNMVYKLLGQTVVVCRADLLITRFGFGKEREKAERRTVVAVIPLLTGTEPDKIEEALDSYIKLFHAEAKNAKLIYFRAQLGLPEDTPVIIAAPPATPDCNVLDMNRVNFVSWFESASSSFTLNKAFRQLTMDRLKKHEDMTGHILSLRSITGHKKAKQNVIKIMLEDKDAKRRLVKAFVYLNTVARTRDAKTRRQYMENGFRIKKYGKDGHLLLDRTIKDVSQMFFRDDVFEHNMRLIHDYHKGKQDYFCIKLTLTRNALRKRATKLFHIRNKSKKTEVLRPVK